VKPFRDPVIYPGAPVEPRIFNTQRNRICTLGGHPIRPGTQVQLVNPGVVACIPCAEEQERQQEQEGTAA
jgi:hypothetical protein